MYDDVVSFKNMISFRRKKPEAVSFWLPLDWSVQQQFLVASVCYFVSTQITSYLVPLFTIIYTILFILLLPFIWLYYVI
jgi:hypothetical protein